MLFNTLTQNVFLYFVDDIADQPDESDRMHRCTNNILVY